jgi:hypothetical protein
MSVPVVAPPKVLVCGFSLAGIAGSNPAGNVDVLLL